MQEKEPIPFSEPPWLLGHPSPYYTDSHRKWQKFCRTFVDEHFTPYAMQWERDGEVPAHVYDTFAKHNMMVPNIPTPLAVKVLKSVGIHRVGPVAVEEFDYLHVIIYSAEMIRCGLMGPVTAITTGFAFGVPPIVHFGSPELQEKFLPDLLTGRTRICIAITEPDAGSDVANVQTVAEKTADGKHYIVNGTKKWITNGMWSDYASMCVRTGGDGPSGLSVLLVPLKNQEGVSMRKIPVIGGRASGTTFIELDDVKVPVENILGKEGHGMKYIMTNFNHERLTIATLVAAQARAALSAAFEWVMKREAFGSALINQAVVRNRLAKAGAELETLWAWIESFAYQMCQFKKEEADVKLGGLTALAKAKAGLVLNECGQCAQLLFGGNGYTEIGQGELAARIAKEIHGARVPGGSEDVLLDLAVRQLYKNYQRQTYSKL
ncbi:hypothetical protein DOTSEDRAFT_62331 [Dothistroma septosporum NZE10]|uniref:Acyl-CoA dehydrogenase-like protein n=1 Tax=Dothistroma septosporum (strain NZE10 / CBS 128990) TaxID=675120 RepID=N1PK75_DOTSN|nr:hypothetical protein DOTSEDRAFT_62331 [Dothistroma septosporum NZE10]